MRPLSLEFEGFTSFRTKQRIDFSELGLFAITGPTGSGKTSILDSMTYALYGLVPRAKKSELRELVSHGLAEARIQFEFAVDGETYRVARKLPRLGQASATLELLDGEEWVPDVLGGGVAAINQRIEELNKLSYAAFTKAVLLPQGQFAEFLKGDPQERRGILIRLLDLDRYVRAGKRAGARERELKAKIEAVSGVLESQFADAIPETLSELKALVRAAHKVHAEFASVRERVEERVNELDVAAARRTRIDDCRQELEAVQERVAALNPDCEELVQDDAGTDTALRATAKTVKRAEAECRQAEKVLHQLVETIGDEGVVQKLVNAVDRRRAALAALGALDERLTTARAVLDEVTGKARDAEASAKKAKQQLEKAQNALKQAIRDDEEAGEALEQARQRVRAETAVADAEVVLSRIEKEQERIARGAQSSREAHQEATERLLSLQQEHAAAILREGLRKGEPCPVCERPLDEHPPVAPDLTTALAEALKEAAEAEGQRRASEQQLAACDERLSKARNDANDARVVLGQLKAALPLDRAKTKFDAAKAKFDLTGGEHKQAERTERNAAEELLTAEAGREQAAQTVRELKGQRAPRKGDLESSAVTIAAGFPSGEPKDLDGELNRRRDDLAVARQRSAEANATMAAAHTDQQQAARDRQEFEQRAAQLDGRVGAEQTRLEMLGDRLGVELQVIPRAPTMPSPPAARVKRDARVAELGRWAGRVAGVAERAATQLDRRNAVLQGSIEDELSNVDGNFGTLTPSDLVRELRRMESDLSTQIEVSRERADGMKKRIDQRTELEAQVQEDRGQADQFNWLATHLRADNFLAFVLQESLNVLAVNASARLRDISDDRYSLCTRNGGFGVIDHANADEERSVNTLSGGETFLASLSLALALSTSVGELATADSAGAHLEAVFIDEGFGALDSDTLDDVVDALERLQAGELTVGVISHVPLLSQRIEEGLVVEKRAEGSMVMVR